MPAISILRGDRSFEFVLDVVLMAESVILLVNVREASISAMLVRCEGIANVGLLFIIIFLSSPNRVDASTKSSRILYLYHVLEEIVATSQIKDTSPQCRIQGFWLLEGCV